MQVCTVLLRGAPLYNLRQVVCHPGVVRLQSKVAHNNRSGRKSYMASKAVGPSDLASVPGVHEPDAATKDFIFQQTMYRIKDPKRSLEFYIKVIGFRLLEKLDFEEAKFSLYFLGHQPADAIPEDRGDRIEWMFTRKACLELTHNWGSEKDPNFKVHNGNDEPQGYGHIGFHVDNVDEAYKRFDNLGVEFVKRPDAGKMKGLAFIKDPDGYWLEIFNGKTSRQFAS